MSYVKERDVLKRTLKILHTVFKEWVRVERRQSGVFKNRDGHMVTIGKVGEPDIGGWVLQGPYIAKPIVIEVKSSEFRPGRLSRADGERFEKQYRYMQGVNHEGGVGFWINDPGQLYDILMPALKRGSRVSLGPLPHASVIISMGQRLKQL
jgi:hypothetical protein